MSIQAVAWVLDQSRSRGFTRLVMISLANHANKETGECWHSVRTIAAEAGVSKSTVADHVRRLVELGEVELLDEGGPRRSARYRLTFPTYVREADEKNVREMDAASGSGVDAASGPETDRTVLNPEGEEASSNGVGSGEGVREVDDLPAVRWAKRWAQLKGVTPTRSVLKSWTPRVQDFIGAGGEPSEALLAAALEQGIDTPGGWGFVEPEKVAAAQKRVDHRGCGECDGSGFVSGGYAPGAGSYKLPCSAVRGGEE